MRYTISVNVPVNGRIGKATIKVLNGKGAIKLTDTADLRSIQERRKAAERLAGQLFPGVTPESLAVKIAELEKKIGEAWASALDQHEAGTAGGDAGGGACEASAEVLDAAPDTIR